MSEAAIQAESLSKHFGEFAAVEDVSLEVGAGEIFGFLGPNGAGKTTTIRMLLGLISPSAGRARLFGRDVARDFKTAIRNVGAFVEGPAFYPFLSGRRNLRLFGTLSGGVTEKRIDQVLDWTGLAAPADSRVSGYSQGMRQRLGLALALLEEPRLLILDEPTNGLDPQGTREIRELMGRIRSESGTTILVSSHLLGEMERICDRVAIIAGGRILQQGTLDDIIGLESERVELGVAPEQDEEASAHLREHFQTEAASTRRGALEFARGSLDLAALNRSLVQAGIHVSSLTPRRRSLEQAFVALTGERSSIR
jgi:ABC-2 type transport system ATP-binding protein